MQQKKAFYKALILANGYAWAGYWDKFHHFTKMAGHMYAHIKANEKDIKNGNIYLMTQYNLTK